MRIEEALEIVLSLAKKAHELENNDGYGHIGKTPEQVEQWKIDQARDLEALNTVEDMVVNQFGKD